MKQAVRTWTCMMSILLGLGMATLAQEPKDAKPPGPRLRVRLVETRQHGDKTIWSRPYVLTLHADEKPAKVFVGPQVSVVTSHKEAPTLVLRNAGVEAEVRAQSLPDGRYRIAARFEDNAALEGSEGATPATRENPIFHVMKGESKLTLREGETVPFASVIDPRNGDLVRVDLAVAAAPGPKASVPSTTKDGRLRAQFVVSRRQGESKKVSRSYSVVLQAIGEEANTFSGSQLPLQVTNQGQASISFKNAGTCVRVSALPSVDGRFALDLIRLCDGSVVQKGASPTLLVLEVETRLFLYLGETVSLASVVDPQTGDVVDVEVTIEAV